MRCANLLSVPAVGGHLGCLWSDGGGYMLRERWEATQAMGDDRGLVYRICGAAGGSGGDPPYFSVVCLYTTWKQNVISVSG